jgi:hypothetical protein
MDKGYLIKNLAKKIGATEDTVINWETRGGSRARCTGGKLIIYSGNQMAIKIGLTGNQNKESLNIQRHYRP